VPALETVVRYIVPPALQLAHDLRSGTRRVTPSDDSANAWPSLAFSQQHPAPSQSTHTLRRIKTF